MSRWADVARSSDGDDYAQRYAERFRRAAAEGVDVHGEAAFVTALVPPPGRVLDAGCGTGRVGVRLAELGYDVTGCDVDASMVAVAAAEAPGLDWQVSDLATLDLGAVFDVVVLAGNVPPLLEPGTLDAVCERLAAHTAPGGSVVCGFGTDEAHLPAGCPVLAVETFVAAAAGAGLVERGRWSTWAGDPWVAEQGYLVIVLTPGLVG